jgi:hypothetical protein
MGLASGVSSRRRYGRRLLEGWVGGAKVELGVPSFLVLVEVTTAGRETQLVYRMIQITVQ